MRLEKEILIRELILNNNGTGIALRGINIDDYHSGPGISSSDIKDLINGTVEAWLYKKENPKPPTPTLILGNAIHCAVLEPEDFLNRYCLSDDAPKAPARSTLEGKAEAKLYKERFKIRTGKDMDFELDSDEWNAEWVKWRHPDFKKIILDSEDMITCWAIAKRVKEHPMVSKMFAHGESEVTLYWIDAETNILCKCRPDRLNDKFPCLPDIKSTMDASLESFEKDITEYDYHVSAWWYLWGAKEVFNKDFGDFVYIPCEKQAPNLVTFYTADVGSLNVGEGLARAGLAVYNRFLNTVRDGVTVPHGTWTGYSLDPKAAGIKPWGFNKLSSVIHERDLHGVGLEKYIGVV